MCTLPVSKAPRRNCRRHADVHYVQPGLPPVHPRTPTSAGRHSSADGEGSSPSFSASGPMHAGQRFSSSSNRVTCLYSAYLLDTAHAISSESNSCSDSMGLGGLSC